MNEISQLGVKLLFALLHFTSTLPALRPIRRRLIARAGSGGERFTLFDSFQGLGVFDSR